MASSLSGLLLLFAVWAPLHRPSGAATFGLDFHHRFSDRMRSWAESTSWDVGRWPEKGTLEYYTSLVAHDRALLRGRGLAASESELTFDAGNVTFKFSALGFLHYSFIDLGTPNVTFLVALDSGSDLFWVPCDCKNCSPTFNDVYNLTFNIFKSPSSSTIKKVPCSSALCEHKESCSAPTDVCPYRVRYLSANTSSSGVLLEDVLHMITDDARQDARKARVTFGCGQVQTGSFLRSGAPNGILGLGLEKVSVPSTLATAGLTADSFSMCFSYDGIGRITFGDKGSSDQDTTPFHLSGSTGPTYNIYVSEMSVGNNSLGVNFSAIFDTGTSFTILSDPAYTLLTETFNSLALDQRVNTGPNFLFNYCYYIGPNLRTVKRPKVSLIMDGGKEFHILHPLVILKAVDGTYIYCLAVLKTRSNLNIIGQNFMTGLKIVFDREKLVLGWKEFDCYSKEGPSPSPANPPSSTVLPPGLSPVDVKQSDGSHSLSPKVTPTTGGSDLGSPPLALNFMICHLLLLTLFIL